jgi:UDP:flavonoid glycosyltransferase YjiC (YdhE family)
MRMLFTCFPAFGHVHPQVPLALAAQAAGHEVRLATGPNMVEWGGRCGLQTQPVGMRLESAVRIADQGVSGPDGPVRLFAQVWVRSALPDLLRLSRLWRPDVIVHEEEEYAGVLVAALIGAHCVTQSWAAPARTAAGRELAVRALTPIWGEYLPGEPPRRVGEIYLDACPPPLQTSDIRDIARTTTVMGMQPSLFDGPAVTIPAALSDLPRPAVYVTLGTVPDFSTVATLDRTAAALSSHFASVIVTTGPNAPDSLAGRHPSNVHLAAYLPQSAMLPKVDLMVSHGGAGGTVAALFHGLPHLVIAGAGQSQRAIAAAIDRLGAGISLPEERRDAADIADAARRLITDPSYAIRTKEIAAQLKSLPSAQAVLHHLESQFR